MVTSNLKTLSIFCLIILSLFSCKDETDSASPVITGFSPAAGVVGTTVTITGTNFGATLANNAVDFNGTAAVVTTYSSASLTTTVPEGATTGPISLTVNGVTTTSATNFAVEEPVTPEIPEFYFGSDLSYVNQILDHGGVYRDGGTITSPYKIFKDHGTNLVRLRLWHNPTWTKTIYGAAGTQLYNDLFDVAKAIGLARAQGMKVLLDFHYSDTWADPGAQEIPAAWVNIKTIEVLEDSVYNYTLKTLTYLNGKGLMPEFVQVGNETNCGMLYESNNAVVAGFPAGNSCVTPPQWSNLRRVINKGILAIKNVSASSSIKTKIILHVADPVNVQWWFDNVTAGVSDFDIIGFSYYPIWHTGVTIPNLSNRVSEFKTRYNKDIMILETAYPWGTTANDSYNNLFGSQTPIAGFPYTPQGQYDIMKAITQELIDGGAIGVIYWEPAWITSQMKDQWNTGSSWENCTFFDFNGNVNQGIDYAKFTYKR